MISFLFLEQLVGCELARFFQCPESKGLRMAGLDLTRRMAPRSVSPCAQYRPPNPSCPQKHHLSICRRHTGGKKSLPCLNTNFLDKVCRKRSPARLRMCRACRGSIPKCRPPLGRKNIEKQNLCLETEPPGDWPPLSSCRVTRLKTQQTQTPPPVHTCDDDVSHQHRLGDFGPHGEGCGSPIEDVIASI